jgi:hypothetical protein
MAHTLTTDTGKEFAQCERIAAALKLWYYIAHPRAALERGANENLNGLLRQFFSKHRIGFSGNSYTLTNPLRFVIEAAGRSCYHVEHYALLGSKRRQWERLR